MSYRLYSLIALAAAIPFGTVLMVVGWAPDGQHEGKWVMGQ